MRKLASVRAISSTYPIKGKDRVEMAVVDGWTCMVSKADNFKPGDLCIFCEPDSVFPANDRWDFLKKYNYRIKTQKFKDEDGNPIYSQGLVLPMSAVTDGKLGDDVTGQLGITQYEPEMDKGIVDDAEAAPQKGSYLMRFKWYRGLMKKLFGVNNTREKFPMEISKTDEERIQNCPSIVKSVTDWVMTEKVDGQSGTFLLRQTRGLFRHGYEFVVCSRNFKTNNKSTSYWKVAEKYDIKGALKKLIGNNSWVCIQGECLGPGIQKNKYGFTDYQFRAFNLIYPAGRCRTEEALQILKENRVTNLEWVPVLGKITYDEISTKTVNDLLTMANGKSQLNPNTKREGIVFRATGTNQSFKAVSPEFLIKYSE